MSWTADLNFIAKDDLKTLDNINNFLTQQKPILKSVHKALELLGKGVTRHQQCHRGKLIVRFVYTRPTENDGEQERRKEAFEKLDTASKSLCSFALTEKEICDLTNTSFDALISGIPKFIQAEPGRHDLIKSTIHDYIQDASDPTDYKFRIIGWSLPGI
ncbi:Fc.00g082440.m01.CDS01 [Cosmosporella sp. VM-42]